MVVDIYECWAGIQSGGARSFWDAALNHRRCLRSFEILGETKVVTLLLEAREFLLVEGGIASRVDDIDSKLWELLEEVPLRLLEYARVKRIVV